MNAKSAYSIIALLSLFTLLVTSQLYAHAELIKAVPAAGELLTTAPESIQLTFNQPIGSGSDIFVFTEGFQYIDNIQIEQPQDSPSQLLATLPQLPPDEYTVQWTAVSEDGHAISGTYAFQIIPPPPNIFN